MHFELPHPPTPDQLRIIHEVDQQERACMEMLASCSPEDAASHLTEARIGMVQTGDDRWELTVEEPGIHHLPPATFDAMLKQLQ